MRKLLLVIALAALVMTGCKTNENNYRAAYEIAKEKFDNEGGLDSTIYNRLRPQGRGTVLVGDGDTVTMHIVTIGYPDNLGASRETVKKYCVVVAQFKQVFNARVMRERLIGDGYTDAMVVNTREPLYYVVAGTSADPDSAVAMLKQLKADKRVVLRDPFPWILQPTHLSR